MLIKLTIDIEGKHIYIYIYIYIVKYLMLYINSLSSKYMCTFTNAKSQSVSKNQPKKSHSQTKFLSSFAA
jgi:hypothetical protein